MEKSNKDIATGKRASGTRRGQVLICMMAVILGMTMAQPFTASAESVSLPAIQANGKTYIEAGALADVLGGKGQYDAKSKQYQLSLSTVPSVVKKVSPSVVAIIGQDEEALEEVEDPRDALSHGTGVVVRADGWIVTNAHVVRHLKKAMVITSDGMSHVVTKVIWDEDVDLALVHINKTGLKPATFMPAAGKVEAGQGVVAIGTPVSFVLQNSVSVGVISGINRVVDNNFKLLQTDTAINPGNSGGPLLNMRGEVVGINTLKYYGEDIDNLGFAIPADTVKWTIDHMLKYGKLKRAAIGVQMDENWTAAYGLPTEQSLRIDVVISANAKKAGIQEGDILLAVNGKHVRTLADINEALKGLLPGKQTKLVLLNGGKKRTVQVTLGEYYKS
ncbi:trypsin-like peptidase domain-containing protein [Paenibacillus sp. UMB4589-SE434]|uniref:S1C family serine protease n=1 Tax=Paenibacillus sp. UMB4589-SE434 TaxID=3046314 RepID=UPI0025501F4A|nr:trypsin-like peptidase domain-containing protein [Paenibacillus sp. UMB4589-SE434]MDK8181666.1 trypsin-like peptidase domain-containing protein [Paenibacillus sp. UMB4589-SE434]